MSARKKRRGTALTPRAQAKLIYTILFGAGFDLATASTVANRVRHMPIDCRGDHRNELMRAINDEIAACRAPAPGQRVLRLVKSTGGAL